MRTRTRLRPALGKLCLCLALAGSALANAAASPTREMVFILPLSYGMPLARVQQGELTGGLLQEFGDALASRLGHRARSLLLPQVRVEAALATGKADALCYATPEWMTGDYNWSVPLFRGSLIVVARPDAPALHSLDELADQPVGTISGHRYPQLETALGNKFIREDVSTTELNLRKLSVGRMQYGIVDQMALLYDMKHADAAPLRADLVLGSFTAQCAFSRRSRIPFEEVNRALAALLKDGSLNALFTRYGCPPLSPARARRSLP